MRFVYLLSSLFASATIAVCIAYVLTLGATDFEGARGFAMVALIPWLFLASLITSWMLYPKLQRNAKWLKQATWTWS
jgi:hypothetical protein